MHMSVAVTIVVFALTLICQGARECVNTGKYCEIRSADYLKKNCGDPASGLEFHCAKSCGFCFGDDGYRNGPTCKNKDPTCRKFLQVPERCDDPTYKLDYHCPETCGFCRETKEPTINRRPGPPKPTAGPTEGARPTPERPVPSRGPPEASTPRTTGPQGENFACPSSKIPTSVAKAFGNSHNKRRSQLANGQTVNIGNVLLPSAKNMYYLQWDCQLEAEAQAWADRCVFEHSSLNGYGENLYYEAGPWTFAANETLVEKSLKAWWDDELRKYGVPSNPTKFVGFSGYVLHFTQMAWGRTTRVGCGIAPKCTKGNNNMALIVCRYRERGNWIGSTFYESGSPCRSDSECTTYPNSRCLSSTGLCSV